MSYAELTRALDELVRAAADAQDDSWTAAVLAAAVVDLEGAIGSGLGPAAGDPLVVLQRRLGRVHRLALAAPHRVDVLGLRSHLHSLSCGAGTGSARCPDAPRGRAVCLVGATV